jgi:hypothetical protein
MTAPVEIIEMAVELPDAPLTLNTLARVAALKAVTLGLKQRGIGISYLTDRELNAIARVYFDEHYAELIAQAEEDIRTNARLTKIAAREEAEALANETSIVPASAITSQDAAPTQEPHKVGPSQLTHWVLGSTQGSNGCFWSS